MRVHTTAVDPNQETGTSPSLPLQSSSANFLLHSIDFAWTTKMGTLAECGHQFDTPSLLSSSLSWTLGGCSA